MEIPMIIANEQLKQELTKIINYGLNELHIPMFTIRSMLKELYTEAETQTQIEYQQTLHQYTEALKAEQAQTTENTTEQN